MIYACDACHFLFKRVGEPEQCPDCGKYSIRPAKEQEIEEFLNRHSDEELSIRNDNNISADFLLGNSVGGVVHEREAVV